MDPHAPCFFFDYVDPLAYLVERELSAAGLLDACPYLRRIPLELRPPPEPLLDPDAPAWRVRWRLASEQARRLGIRLAEPSLIPWTRKAHEMVFHAADHGLGEEAHRLVFDAVFLRGADVGRVDVLVALAGELGLDATATKAVLDVDRHAARVAAGRRRAARAGVSSSPALTCAWGTIEGFHNRDALRTFLLR